jgi:pyruvate dehydrogenase E2 component (dihydrolipoamide acetyltransferase)
VNDVAESKEGIMARWEFKLPDIGEGVAEGEIVTWLVKAGDVVTEDQPMVEVMTDKATVTIGAPRAGSIVETRGKVGEVVAVHAVLVVFELTGGAATSEPSAKAPAPAPKAKGNGNGVAHGAANQSSDGPAATAVGDIREDLPGMGARPRPVESTRAAASPGGAGESYFNEKPLATPATRQMARELSIDLKQVKPSGPQGRVTKQDLLAFSHGAKSEGAPAVKPGSTGAAAPLTAREPVRITPPTSQEGKLEERVPFAGLRRKIAAKMALSKQTAAHFTFVEECDVTALKALRSRFKGHAESLGVKLSYLPFIVKACVAALKRHPILNSALDESTQELVYRRYYNIGVATSTEAGLIVPVVKGADHKSLLEIARDIERVSSDAKAGKSKADDLSGSTFTITSLGAQGGLFATPILNFPEVGILGVHRIKERPVVKEGRIVIGDVMLLSLSFDHRIVDGHVGAAFAYELIGYLEEPDKLLLEMG